MNDDYFIKYYEYVEKGSALLSEVLGIEILSFKEVKQTSFIRYKFNAIGETRDSSINVYELAHLCKIWALNHRYILLSKPRTNSSFASCSFDKIGKCNYEDDFYNDFRAETEPNAIFKACLWILEQIKKEKK